MNPGVYVLVLVPLACGLVIVNCVSWVLVRLHTGGLPVQMGIGWPWSFYTYAVNRVGPSEFLFSSLLLDIGVGVAILLSVTAIVLLLARSATRERWN
jgi:hypothetical protein